MLLFFGSLLYSQTVKNSKNFSKVVQTLKGVEKYADMKTIEQRVKLFCSVNAVLIPLGLANDIYVLKTTPIIVDMMLDTFALKDHQYGSYFHTFLVAIHCTWNIMVFSSAAAFVLFYSIICMVFENSCKKIHKEIDSDLGSAMKLHNAITELLLLIDKKVNFVFFLCFLFFELVILRTSYTIIFAGTNYYECALLLPTVHVFILFFVMIGCAVKLQETGRSVNMKISSLSIENCNSVSLPLMDKAANTEITMTLWGMVSVTKTFAFAALAFVASYIFVIGSLKPH
ncbi:hypothetical protein AVEN_190226-1 [Araneus ventricosus]|uniref:Uncharacterized protein n=1 Tax=Araneus ventricosus TaxID=182803 RepID=A0A4Y2FC35_ARAVE|nr:hypothetical protein AVEN_190226-1 [Araneus ventricosus]